MKYNKLVRNHIPDIIKKKGGRPVIHIADDQEYWEKLKMKLQEEVDETLEDSNMVEELADVLEVIHAMLEFRGVDFSQVERIRVEKKEERGGFSEKIILESVN